MPKTKKGMANWFKVVIAVAVVATIGAVGYYGVNGDLFQGRSIDVGAPKISPIQPLQIEVIEPEMLKEVTSPMIQSTMLSKLVAGADTNLLQFTLNKGAVKELRFDIETKTDVPVSSFRLFKDQVQLQKLEFKVDDSVQGKKTVIFRGYFLPGTYVFKGQVAKVLKPETKMVVSLGYTRIRQEFSNY